MTWNLPNLLTVGRIAVTPVVAVLPFVEGFWPKLAAFCVFIAAAITDVIDGRIARSRGLITDLGKTLDPLADKLLLLATLGPVWWITTRHPAPYGIPVWGAVPLWACLVVLGRELAMTLFRGWAQRQGVVIAAGQEGKIKASLQNVFIGGALLWLAFRDLARDRGWEAAPAAAWWHQFHGGFVAATLAIALTLTVWSFGAYLMDYRRLIR